MCFSSHIGIRFISTQCLEEILVSEINLNRYTD